MIAVAPATRILVAVEAVSFRFGIDRLSQFCRAHLQQDPMGGTVFVFRNRASTMMRLLFYDGQGFFICTKRFSSGHFKYWPAKTGKTLLSARELAVLLCGGNPEKASFHEDWRPLPPCRPPEGEEESKT